MADKQISNMIRATEAHEDDLLLLTQPDSTSDTGYISRAGSVATVADEMLNGIQYATELITPNKTILGAINDAYNHGGGGDVPDNVVTSDTLEKKNIWVGTKAEFDAIQNKTEDIYITTDEESEEVDKAYVDEQVGAVNNALNDTNTSLDTLWKLSKGQVWDISQEIESGLATPPKGAKYESLIDVRGESKQTTYDGRNLIPLNALINTYSSNGVVFTNNKDGSITMVGTATAYANPRGNELIHLEAGTYSLNEENCQFRDAESLGKIIINKKGSFTLTEPKDVQFRCFVMANDTVNKTIYPMLEKGSEIHEYEPYVGGVPSPNPDYPQPIHSVEEINIKKIGKNFFDGEIEFGNISSGTNVSAGNVRRSKNYIEVRPNETYTFSIDSSAYKMLVSYYDSNKVWMDTDGNISGQYVTTGVFTTPNNCRYIRFRSYSADVDLFTHDLMIELGSVATDYEPYTEELKTITPPAPLNGIGSNVDFADVENGEWKYLFTKRTIGRIFTAKDSSGTGHTSAIPELENSSNANPMMSDSLTFHIVSGANMREYSIKIVNNLIYVKDSQLNTATEYNDKYENTIIVAKLVEPTTEPINAEDLEFLKSLTNLDTESTNLIVTDQDGNDISFLMEYIIKLSEVN